MGTNSSPCWYSIDGRLLMNSLTSTMTLVGMILGVSLEPPLRVTALGFLSGPVSPSTTSGCMEDVLSLGSLVTSAPRSCSTVICTSCLRSFYLLGSIGISKVHSGVRSFLRLLNVIHSATKDGLDKLSGDTKDWPFCTLRCLPPLH